jgi:hypothetical protein
MEGVDTVDDVVGDIVAGTIGVVTDDQTHDEGCERRGLVWEIEIKRQRDV